jgi:hypothetical protein
MKSQKYECSISHCGEPEPHELHKLEGGYHTVRYGWVDKICPGMPLHDGSWTVRPGLAIYASFGDEYYLDQLIVAEEPTPLRWTLSGKPVDTPVVSYA